jgi:hypothetical protein
MFDQLFDKTKGIIDFHTSTRLLEPGPQYILVVGLIALGFLAVWLKWGRKK